MLAAFRRVLRYCIMQVLESFVGQSYVHVSYTSKLRLKSVPTPSMVLMSLARLLLEAGRSPISINGKIDKVWKNRTFLKT